ncbi:hypothetical protein AB3Y40_03060 [Yoonia sp. R2331]|uniref:hypothetical protein n=1 Tax=Yoonia sp. R2331 TaxID=3237238 RepID=UPI0034E4A429
MTVEFAARCTALVVELGLGKAEDMRLVAPLAGGVASDIGKVILADKTICIKFALPKLKVNQAGTLTEAVDAFKAAYAAGYRSVVSARSGETEDVAISHLATGLGAGQLKVGSFTRSERMAKWNACLRIQNMLGRDAFVGGAPLANTWWGCKNNGEQR